MNRDDRVLALAARIADGSAIDWPATDASTPDSVDATVLAELKDIAVVATLHRTPASPVDGATEAGSHWGPLTIMEPIGEGRFGRVFRAWDPRLQRQVALKLLHAASPSAAASPNGAIDEARLLARVRHPHVLAVYGAECLDGQVGIWTEFIEGRTLAMLIAEQQPLSIPEAVAIGIDLCGALAAVHHAGLLHRDVKAQNVMRETGGRIVLMDFGTGLDLGAAPAVPGDLSGTPLYLAPEVLKGAPADVRADLYAAGILLYYLLTGAFPVEGRTLDEVRGAHEAEQRIALRDRRRDVPPAVATVIERAISPDPTARLESAAALERALAAAVSLPRRTRAMAGWAVAAFVLLATATGFVWRRETVVAKPWLLKPRDFVLVGAFDNRTGSPAFDGVVEAAVQRELASSQFINVVSQPRIDDSLRLMSKPVNTPLQPDVARDVSRKDGGISTYLTGGIERVGRGYKVSAFAFDPMGGRVVSAAEAEAMDVSGLQSTIHQLSNRLRANLGESAAGIRESDQEFEKMTTPSLQSVRLFSGGLRAFAWENYAEAKLLFNSAIGESPGFAPAYIWLAWMQWYLNESAEQYLASAQRAMDLAPSASEHERESIAASYYQLMGRKEQMIAQYEALLRRYPDDLWALRQFSQYNTNHGSDRRPEVFAVQARMSDAQPQNFLIQTDAGLGFLQAGDWNSARVRIARARFLMRDLNDKSDDQIAQANMSILVFPVYGLWIGRGAADAAHLLDGLSDRPEFAIEENWTTLNLLGMMRLALGQLHQAEDAFSRIQRPRYRRLGLAEVALARGDRDGMLAQLEDPLKNDLIVASLLIRAGQLDAASRFRSTFAAATTDSPLSSVWSANEIEEARGDRERIARALEMGVPWTTMIPASGRAFMYSETLARAAERIGDRAAAIKVLEDTSPTGFHAYAMNTTPVFFWTRNQELLADLYRADGQIEKARAIERDLLLRLGVADADYPLLVELKHRVGQ